jgi:hypothetical protein
MMCASSNWWRTRSRWRWSSTSFVVRSVSLRHGWALATLIIWNLEVKN